MFERLHHRDGNKNAVVYVHGFTGHITDTWGEMPALLGTDSRLDGWDHCAIGYESSRLFDIAGLWSADARIQEIATLLYTALTSRDAHYQAIALVAHSMGGLVVQRALVDHPDFRDRVSHVVLFGTPSGGLSKANLFSFWKRQVRNMATTGTFIPALRAEWDRLALSAGKDFTFVTVAGESDQFVPPESSLMPFPAALRRVIPGNHLTMIRTDVGGSVAADLVKDVLVGDASPAGPRTAARLALETKRFQQVVDALWPTRAELDAKAAVQLAVALDSLARREEAMEVLRPHCETDSDAMGTLGGRLKRRWLVSRRRADAEEALKLYTRGYELSRSAAKVDHAQAYYHATNVAFMHLAYGGDMEAASRYAHDTLRHCDAAPRVPDKEHWRLASAGDASMILGQVEQALQHHAAAVQASADPWQALSSQEQALRVADLCGVEEETTNRLSAIYIPA